MSKLNSRLQVRIPSRLVEQLGINPGDEIDWEIAGEVLLVIPAAKRRREKSDASIRPHVFDQATQRQRKRDSMIDPLLIRNARPGPGWTRGDLYSVTISGPWVREPAKVLLAHSAAKARQNNEL